MTEMKIDLNDYIFTQENGRKYLQQNGLEHFIALGDSEELPPKWDDLARLYKLVRTRKPFQVLEFGSGFSTIVMACALKQNWEDYLGSRAVGQSGSRAVGQSGSRAVGQSGSRAKVAATMHGVNRIVRKMDGKHQKES